MEVLQLLTSFLLCPTLRTDQSVFEGKLYRGSTVKLILSNSSIFPQNIIYSDFLHAILLLESVKLIISERHLTDVPKIYQTQNCLHNDTSLRIFPIDGLLRFSIKTEVAFAFLNVNESQDEYESPAGHRRIDTEMIQINSNYKGFQLRGHLKFPFNLSPNNVQYIFIGRSSDVQTVLKLEQIRILKFKRGVAVKDEQIENVLMERPLPFTRDVAIGKVNVRSRALNCDLSHSFLRHQHIVIDSYPSKLYRFTDENGRHIGGMCYKFAETIATRYNFTFDYRFEGHRLKQLANGSWTGWIGDMVEGRADMTMMPGPTMIRYPYFEPTNSPFYMQFGLLGPTPRAGVRWQSMFLTLNPDVWLGIGLVFLSAAIMFYFSFKIDQVWFNMSLDGVPFHSLIAVVLIFLRKDAKLPSSGRLFSVSFLIFSLYVGSFFESKLTSFLTLPRLDPVPETLDELAGAPDFQINFIHFVGSIGTVYLETNQDPAVKAVVARMNYVPVENYTEPLAEIALGNKAVMMDYQELAMVDVAEDLTLFPGVYPVKLGQFIVGFHSTIGMRKYSKYHEEVNLNVGRLVDTGHFLKWKQDAFELARSHGSGKLRLMRDRGNLTEFYEKLLRVTEQLLSSPFKPFTLDHFVFCFSSWALGLAAGFVLFMIEFKGTFVEFRNNKVRSKEILCVYDRRMTPVVAYPLSFVEIRRASGLRNQNGAERRESYQRASPGR